MKNIKYLVSIFIVTITMISCTETDIANFNDLAPTNVTDVVLNISSINEVTAEGVDVPFTVTLPSAYNSTASVQVSLDFVGGRINESIDIAAGETSGSGTISMAGDDALTKFTGIPVELTATALVLDAPGVGNPSVFNVSSNVVPLTSFDEVQFDYGAGTVAGRATVLLDWENPAVNNLDFRIFDTDLNLIESAGSTSRYETDIINDTHPDADYFLVVDLLVATAPIDYQVFFVQPDQETIKFFSGTFTEDDVAAGLVFPVIEFTKSTDGEGNSVYTFPTPTKRVFTQAQIDKMNSQKVQKEN